MHIMAYHVPDLIRRHGNIKQFSCQGNDKDNQLTFYGKELTCHEAMDLLVCFNQHAFSLACNKVAILDIT